VKERDRMVATGLVALMLVLWLGFLVHTSPRFPGSLAGGILGMSGATLMLVPFFYSVIKRVPPVKRSVTKAVPMRTLLSWHIYAGIVGPILALLHTAHKFDSKLGIALTAMMLIVVLSGFTGRYLMSHISEDLREKKNLQAALLQQYQETAAAVAKRPEMVPMFSALSSFSRWLRTYFLIPSYGVQSAGGDLYVRAVSLAESISDLQYAVEMDEFFKSWFSRWLRFHIALSAVLYILLGLHIWAEVHFGIRWFKA
jgi:hypothetical protein